MIIVKKIKIVKKNKVLSMAVVALLAGAGGLLFGMPGMGSIDRTEYYKFPFFQEKKLAYAEIDVSNKNRELCREVYVGKSVKKPGKVAAEHPLFKPIKNCRKWVKNHPKSYGCVDKEKGYLIARFTTVKNHCIGRNTIPGFKHAAK